MNLVNEVITLDNDLDYLVYDSAIDNDITYYLLFRLENDEVTDDLIILKSYDEGKLETIEDNSEFNKAKELLIENNINRKHNVPTVHNEANYKDIAPLVIMPGDPLRAKYIAENYLNDFELVNDERNVLAYTGYYNNQRVTIMAAGMGMPSAGIYYYELFKFYDVEKIIRVGTCGAHSKDEKLLDVVIADKSFTTSNFAETFSGSDTHVSYPSFDLTNKLKEECEKSNQKYFVGGVVTMDFFGPYIDVNKIYEKVPKDFDIMAEEMECFGLFHIASTLNKEAACILTIVDSPYDKNIVSSEDREKKMDNMIKIALDAITTK